MHRIVITRDQFDHFIPFSHPFLVHAHVLLFFVSLILAIGWNRMYQAYLASGDMAAAVSFLNKVPKDDPHVRSVIHACRVTYGKPKDQEKKKKKKI